MGGANSLIINELENYFTYNSKKPKVIIEDDWVTIDIDVPDEVTQKADYHRVTSLCEKGKFKEAKLILNDLLVKNPTVSEYHRIMGQILSEEGDQEEAINFLIDALRWDSKNGWALLMMGNIFSKFKNDVPTAMKYYDQALIANPKDNITVNNILFFLSSFLTSLFLYFHFPTAKDSACLVGSALTFPLGRRGGILNTPILLHHTNTTEWKDSRQGRYNAPQKHNRYFKA